MDIGQIERIKRMEQALNASAEAVEALFSALERYRAVMPRIAELEEYYQSPVWMSDYDDDNAGRLPKDLCRGVLTEDALYDLLCDNDELRRELRSLTENLR